MNSKNANNYKKAVNSVKLSGDFNTKAIARLHEEARKIKREAPAKRNRLIRYCAAAAAVLIVIAGGIGYDLNRRNIDLPNSDGVSARFTYFTPFSRISSQFDLATLSEAEAVENSDLIISACINTIKNIKIDFGGRFSEDWSIVTASVETALKGDSAPGDTISFLHLTPLATSSIWVDDNEIASQLNVGSRAILFLKKYNESTVFSKNGNTLCLADITDYGLPNGLQYAIVETGEGLAFSDATYVLPAGATYEEAIDHIRIIIG